MVCENDGVREVRRRRRGMTRWAAAMFAGLVLAAAAAPAKAAEGIQLLSTQQLDALLTELELSTPALKSPTRVRVLLPAGYDANPGESYPVLYLLHGALGNDADWTTVGD